MCVDSAEPGRVPMRELGRVGAVLLAPLRGWLSKPGG
jgi:hypothetical protein